MKALEAAAEQLAQWSKAAQMRTKRLDVLLDAHDLLAAIEAIQSWGYFSSMIGLDEGDYLAILYIFASGDSVLCLKVQLPRENPHIASIYRLIPASLLQERELQEMFGIVVDDIPDSARLLLPEDWPDELYPLRKDVLLDQGGA